jgi:glycine/serine hydroxymethyltransferase
MIHGDTLKPAYTSGVRIGFAASTSRGCNKAQAVEIADIIFDVLSKNISLSEAKDKVASIVKTWHDVMSLQYPLVG